LKILLVGLGSIGKRHLKNILQLGYTDITVVSRSGILPNEFSQCIVFSSIENAIASLNYDKAIICLPTALHIDAVVKLIKAGIKNIYLEKPVSHTYDGIEDVLQLLQQTKTKIIVGYDLHYDLGLQKVKELISLNTIGTIVSANAQVGQYLPDWRPHEDYSKGMSAKKETGGGVLLDLVHEFDYLYWLLGDVKTIASFNKNSGSLEIQTEDIAEVLLQFKNGAIASVHLDYLQQKLVRNCLFTGSEGTVFWNLAASKVQWVLKDKSEHEFDYAGFERNDRFVAIIKDFLTNSSNNKTTTFQQALQSLKMVLAAKYSSANEVFVKIDSFNFIPGASNRGI